MRTIIAALALLISATAAQAFEVNTRCTTSKYYGTNCRTIVGEAADQQVYVNPAQARIDAEAKNREIAKWEAFCKPQRVPDKDGMMRLEYAQPGCASGRSE